MGLWQVEICNLTEAHIWTNNYGAGSVPNSEWIFTFAIWKIHQDLWICNSKISHLLQLYFTNKNGVLVLLCIFLAAHNFKVWINAQAQGCNPCHLLPAEAAAAAAVAEAAAAAVAAAAAGWLSVWHDARGTAWQTPWPQMCLLNRP